MRIPQILQRNCQVAPTATATIDGSRTRTWQELTDRVARLAGGLKTLGVEPGDRVAMLGLNSDRYLEWFFGVSWVGAVFVPINIRLAPAEIVEWLQDSGSRALFIDDTFLPMLPALRQSTPDLEHVIYVGEGEAPEGLTGYEALVGASEPIAANERGGNDLAGLFYTGGTTGRSKGVMLSHNNLLSNALHLGCEVDASRDSVYLHAAPMFHIANGGGMFCSVLIGAKSVFIPAFEPKRMLDAIEAHRVTFSVVVPAMIKALRATLSSGSWDLSSLRQLAYGAAPMSEKDIAATLEALPDVALYQGYGQTEAAPILTLLRAEDHVFEGARAGKTRSAGQAVVGVELAILDDQDAPVPRGTVGEICARADNVMLGYFNRPEATAETLRNGWLHTGDVGYMDDDGYLYVVDRAKDMIVTGGENVFSAEVENALESHPAIYESAVIGVPSEDWGEQVHAVVTTNDSVAVTAEELIAHCRERIAAFKCPKSVAFHTEELPKSGAGKVLKRELRADYWESHERAVH